MDYTDILFVKDKGVATLTINRPERYNALRLKTLEETILALDAAADDPAIGVVVITGTGDKAFCTGGDIGDAGDDPKSYLTKLNRNLLHLASLLRSISKPVIAAVNGLCIGGGNELNAFCDLTLASEKARFGQAEPRIGTAPLWGGTQLLPRILGEKRAREMVFFCRQYSAEEAYELGLVNKVVPHERLYEEVRLWCDELLAMSPQALKLCKLSMNFESDQLWPSLTHGMAMIDLLWDTEEMEEGITSFKVKRKPDFSRFRKGN